MIAGGRSGGGGLSKPSIENQDKVIYIICLWLLSPALNSRESDKIHGSTLFPKASILCVFVSLCYNLFAGAFYVACCRWSRPMALG